MRRIPVFFPFVPKESVKSVVETLESTQINIGKKTEEFEKKFSKMFKIKYSVAVNSCTSALRLCYSVAGVGPDTEVITTPFTMIATNTPVLENYGKPVFADVQYETANIEPKDIEHRITEKTKAIACTHNLGYPCDLDELRAIANKHNLYLIEDCAHAIGATYHNEYIGQNSDFACFSFHAVKHITTGDGGMFATKKERIYNEAYARSWFSFKRENRDIAGGYNSDIDKVGYKMRMNNICASLGIEALPYIPRLLEIRKRNAERLEEGLKDMPGIRIMEYKIDRTSAYYLFPIHVEKRQQFIKKMYREGIEVYLQNQRNDRLSIFGGLRKDLPNLERIDKDFICLPLHQNLKDADLEHIIKTIKRGW